MFSELRDATVYLTILIQHAPAPQTHPAGPRGKALPTCVFNKHRPGGV